MDDVTRFLSEPPENPLPLLADWLDAARTHESDPWSAVLATVDSAGRPSTRSMTLHGLCCGGLLLFMNLRSRKGSDVAADPRCALTVYWPTLFRQVNVSGELVIGSADESDRLWSQRGPERQAVSLGSAQGLELDDLAALRTRIAHTSAASVRPAHHSAMVLTPRTIEFWLGRTDLMHGRVHYERDAGAWRHTALQP